ncbi:FtsW/RodA/SpoVE family cell cycle protein [Metabacillus sp. GX 13764]|uniref:FtsW/RodA/SpoVE family cell cycle protein n=1 Tax=Metabacillus kandeliae TaxID=2900151 RepID=UPI001E5F7D32|nr:FtsW/RodA/SpoVE family cell cycle protein [Metabacillus kandeliae]MCD7035488.1 FtsW/RodA/SpoVE family cell cycle protein [Metabacillus kandeliae]
MERETKMMGSRFDYQLAFLLFLFFCVSCIAIYGSQLTSGQYSEGLGFVYRQILFYFVGSGIIAGVMFFDSDQLQRLSWYLYGFGLFLLGLLIIAPSSIAKPVNGAKSWFNPTSSLTFQPSELVKTFVIIAISHVIVKHNAKHTEKTVKTDFILLFKIGLTALVPIAFIMKQPDLGTALVIIAIATGLILVSGISWKIITTIFLSITLVAVTVFYLVLKAPNVLEALGFHQYQFGRITSWLNPEEYSSGEGYHLLNSMKAIGSGQIYGKGFGNSQVYIPENHTDFIFSVIGEQFGFLGTSVVLSLFFLLVYHLIKVAMETTEPFNSYLCAGVISMIVFHVFQNAGMTIGLLPITGIPLPFISYGGSAILGSMLGMGLIFGIRYHHRVYMFSDK